MKKEKTYRFIFAGGGTGGHLFPAVAVAQQLRELKPEAEILFVGTKNKIEADIVPSLGFNFRTIWIAGFSRKLTLKNLLFPLKLFFGTMKALWINIVFKPRVVIGTGSYVAGPVVWAGSVMGAKIMLLEQNSYPGVTNRMLEKKAEEVHVSFEESKKYFRNGNKLFLSGNPVRINLVKKDKEESLRHFGLKSGMQTIFVTGGSLGAGSINQTIAYSIDILESKNIQVIWQTGKLYYDKYKMYQSDKIKIMSFVDDMSAAYSCSDLVIARAGATTIAEVSYLGVPVLFVPSPNVAADHQFKNAKALKELEACELLHDSEIKEKLINVVKNLLSNQELRNKYSNNIKNFSRPDAALNIAGHAIKLAESN